MIYLYLFLSFLVLSIYKIYFLIFKIFNLLSLAASFSFFYTFLPPPPLFIIFLLLSTFIFLLAANISCSNSSHISSLAMKQFQLLKQLSAKIIQQLSTAFWQYNNIFIVKYKSLNGLQKILQPVFWGFLLISVHNQLKTQSWTEKTTERRFFFLLQQQHVSCIWVIFLFTVYLTVKTSAPLTQQHL